MKNNSKKLFFHGSYILLAFFAYVIITNLDYTVFAYNDVYRIVSKIMRYLCYLVFFSNIVYNISNKEKKISLYSICFLALAILVMFFSKNTYIIILWIILNALKNEKIERIVNCCFIANFLAFIFIFLGSCLKIIPNWSYFRSVDKIRYSMGYHYPTICATYLFLLILMYFYKKKGRVDFKTSIFEFTLAGLVYCLTDSRTAFFLSIIVVIIQFMFLYKNKYMASVYQLLFNDKTKCIIALFPVIICILAFLMIFLYSSNFKFMIPINEMLSDRLSLSSNAIQKYGVPIFGTKIKWFGWSGVGYVNIKNFEYNFVDNAYIYIMLNYGVLFLITLIVQYFIYFKKLLKNNRYLLIIINIIILIWAFVEPNLLEVGKNAFIIELSYIFNDGICLRFKNGKITLDK